MANQAAIPKTKGIGNIKWADLSKGLYYASIGTILTLVGFIVESILTEHPHFPSWVEILPYIKGVVASLGGYIVGKFGVNNVGQVLQKDKEVVRIDVDTLDDLKENQDVK